MKFTTNVIFCAFLTPIILLYGEYTLRVALGYIGATALLSIVAIHLMSVIERHMVNETV